MALKCILCLSVYGRFHYVNLKNGFSQSHWFGKYTARYQSAEYSEATKMP